MKSEDTGWARQRLDEFVETVSDYLDHRRSPGGGERMARSLRQEPTVKKILLRLQPDLGDFDVSRQPHGALADARRGLGILRDEDEVEAHLGTQSPALPADQLHPWVWGAAQTLWDSGHYRLAVQAAATSVNAHAQKLVDRRDVSDDKLMQEIFSSSPPQPGKSRLRCPGDVSDQTVQSRQRGALSFAVGCFFALRNPASHEEDEWPDQMALEALAAFSILARWIEEWPVESTP